MSLGPVRLTRDSVEVLEKKSGVLQYERISQLSSVMVKEVAQLDMINNSLSRLKVELLQCFSDVLMDEYSTERAGQVQLDTHLLKKHIENVQIERRAIKRLAEASSVELPSQITTPSCTIA